MNIDEARKVYIEELMASIKGVKENTDIKMEALEVLENSGILKSVEDEYNKCRDKYIQEVILPLYEKVLYVLENRRKLREHEMGYINSLIEKLKERDKNFNIRQMALEDFFNSEAGKKLREEDKIEIALKTGALDARDLSFFNNEGNLVEWQNTQKMQ